MYSPEEKGVGGKTFLIAETPGLRRWVDRFLAMVFLVGSVSFGGCLQTEPMESFEFEKNYERPLPPGAVALEKVALREYPDFAGEFDRGGRSREDLKRSIRLSLEYFARPSSQGFYPYLDIDHGRAIATLEEFLQDLDRVSSGRALDELIRQKYDVYRSVGFDGRGTVLFTGYYEPIFQGRLRPDAQYRYPLYSLPPDLEKDEKGQCLGRRTSTGALLPYYTREEIDLHGVLRGKGLEIVYLRDPVDAYTVTIQGSARIRLGDGRELKLGYAGSNGYDYVSVAKALLAEGKLRESQVSLKAVRRYLHENPQEMMRWLSLNPRYIFFSSREGGAVGSLNVEVTPLRSIATDKEVFPRGCLAFVDARLPDGRGSASPFQTFVLDQDTGGAIRSAGRTDIFIGTGASAEKIAGQVLNEGRLYYLFLKPGWSGRGRSTSTRSGADSLPTSSSQSRARRLDPSIFPDIK